MEPRFARKSDGLNAHVCKDVTPKYKRKPVKLALPDSSKSKYQKIVLRIPDEYAFSLLEMYGKGLQGSIMKHIRSTVVPVELENEQT